MLLKNIQILDMNLINQVIWKGFHKIKQYPIHEKYGKTGDKFSARGGSKI
jgi:hypothetical protein